MTQESNRNLMDIYEHLPEFKVENDEDTVRRYISGIVMDRDWNDLCLDEIRALPPIHPSAFRQCPKSGLRRGG